MRERLSTITTIRKRQDLIEVSVLPAGILGSLRSRDPLAIYAAIAAFVLWYNRGRIERVLRVTTSRTTTWKIEQASPPAP